MTMDLSKLAAKVVGDKRRWRTYKARTEQLPTGYRDAIEALERYLMHFVPTDDDSAVSMFEDLADLFEQAVAEATPIREIVGEAPLEFAEAFAQNYTEGGYTPTRARKRLTDAIARAEEAGGGTRS